MELNDSQTLDIGSQLHRARRIRVTAIFHDEDEANEYLESHPDQGVVDQYGPYIFLAKLQDMGR